MRIGVCGFCDADIYDEDGGFEEHRCCAGDMAREYEQRIAKAEAVIRAIADNEDCRYASCGIACREYFQADGEVKS